MTTTAIFKLNKVIDEAVLDGYVKAPTAVTNTESTAIELAVVANKHYTFTTPLTSLKITEIPTSPLTSSVSFSLDIQGATVTLPTSADTVGNTVFEAGKKYILVVMMGTIFIHEKN